MSRTNERRTPIQRFHSNSVQLTFHADRNNAIYHFAEYTDNNATTNAENVVMTLLQERRERTNNKVLGLVAVM